MFGRCRTDPDPRPVGRPPLPAVLTVNAALDTANPGDPHLSLRQAIAIVNSPTLPEYLSAGILAPVSGPLHGGGTDTIVFDRGHVPGGRRRGQRRHHRDGHGGSGQSRDVFLDANNNGVIDDGDAGVGVAADPVERPEEPPAVDDPVG